MNGWGNGIQNNSSLDKQDSNITLNKRRWNLAVVMRVLYAMAAQSIFHNRCHRVLLLLHSWAD
jgi:hypothetical protein